MARGGRRSVGRQPGGRGQSIIEYMIVLSLLLAAVSTMLVFSKRAMQAKLKFAADRLSPCANDPDGTQAQAAGIRFESGDRSKGCGPGAPSAPSKMARPGYVVVRKVGTHSESQQQLEEETAEGGARARRIVKDASRTTGTVAGGAANVSVYSEVVVRPSQ